MFSRNQSHRILGFGGFVGCGGITSNPIKKGKEKMRRGDFQDRYGGRGDLRKEIWGKKETLGEMPNLEEKRRAQTRFNSNLSHRVKKRGSLSIRLKNISHGKKVTGHTSRTDLGGDGKEEEKLWKNRGTVNNYKEKVCGKPSWKRQEDGKER